MSWDDILRAGVRAQQLISGCVAVGGTAAALYARHRVSMDTDHLLPNLAAKFDDALQTLESTADWKTARTQRPVLILGSISGVEVGYRQQRRAGTVDTQQLQTPHGPLVVPTLDELIGMKAYLAYSRRAVRDFLDFAALSKCVDDSAVVAALEKSDARYGSLQTVSVGLEIAKALTDPQPIDLDQTDLQNYKGVQPPWNNWGAVAARCRKIGVEFAKRIVL